MHCKYLLFALCLRTLPLHGKNLVNKNTNADSQKPTIVCKNCDPSENVGAYYEPSLNSITICSNTVHSVHQVPVLVIHELVHVIDVSNNFRNIVNKQHCTQRYNLTKCPEIACSEIRAAMFGECKNEFKWNKKSCILKNAIFSVKAIRLYFCYLLITFNSLHVRLLKNRGKVLF
jgi:hypothetical protein